MKNHRWLAPAGLAFALAACSGQNAAVTPAAPQAAPPQATMRVAGPTVRDAVSGHLKHLFFSRGYLREHARPSVASPDNLIYGGGPIETTPKIYLIFWGFAGPADSAHDPDGMAAYLVNFYTAIGKSKWIASDTQYYQRIGRTKYVTNPKAQLAGVWYDSTASPLPVYQDSDVAAEAVRGSSHFGYATNANYIVVTPTHTLEPGFAAEWCAYHSSTTVAGKNLAYTDLPYQPDALSNCGAGSVNNPGTLDGASIVGGHEEAETQTDPGAGNGWLDSSGNENGDKCAWTGLQNTTFPDGSSFPTQPLWSNATASCVQSY